MKNFLGLFSLLLNISRIELLYWWTFTSNTLLLVVLTSRNLFRTFDSFVNFFAWTWADCQKRWAIATNTVSIWLNLKFCSWNEFESIHVECRDNFAGVWIRISRICLQSRFFAVQSLFDKRQIYLRFWGGVQRTLLCVFTLKRCMALSELYLRIKVVCD